MAKKIMAKETMAKEDSTSNHSGYLQQMLKRIEGQIDHLKIEVKGVATLPMTSQLSGQDSVEELGHSLRAKIQRLQHELNLCESELMCNRVQASVSLQAQADNAESP